MFSKDYWYIGTLTVLLITMEVFAVLYLSRRKWATRIVLWLLAIYVIVTQTVTIVQKGTFSFAFSTVSYWMFVAAVLVPFRMFKSAAAMFSFSSGLVYAVAFAFYPDIISHLGPFNLGYFPGYVVHNVMFVGSLLLCCQIRFKRRDLALVGILVAAMVCLTELGLRVFHWPDMNEFLVGMVETTILQTEYFPEMQITWWWMIGWYIAVVALLWGFWELLNFIDKRLSVGGQQCSGEFVW